MTLLRALGLCGLLLLSGGAGSGVQAADDGWLQPPPEVLSVLHASEPPRVLLSPPRTHMILATDESYPPLSELSRPLMRLAGARFDPAWRTGHGARCMRELSLRALADEQTTPIPLPDGACVTGVHWSADGARYALTLRAEGGLELWVGGLDRAPRRVKKLRLNPILGEAVQWMPDQRTLLVLQVPVDLGAPPAPPATPLAPMVHETSGAGPSSTYEARDLLVSAYDEALFAHYAKSQIALVDAERGRVTALGSPGLYGGVSASPDGAHLLVWRVRQPFSRRVAWYRFAHDLEVWDRQGRLEKLVQSLPVIENIPIQGEPAGPREMGWRPTAPATLVWLEALDEGDPSREVPHRDRMMTWDAPFSAAPRELWRALHRISDLWWGASDGLLLVEEWERERRWLKTWILNADDPAVTPVTLLDRSSRDRYGSPGAPVVERRADGTLALAQDGPWLYFSGQGSSPEGDRPFLDRRSLSTGAVERLFRSAPGTYESVLSFAPGSRERLLTRLESQALVPNLQLRAIDQPRSDAPEGEAQRTGALTPLTRFEDPTPMLRRIQKRIVTATRADGVQLSFKLTLPPDYVEGTPLPTVLTAYPMEYSDAGTAGQIGGTDQTFTQLRGSNPLFLVLSGYAVLSDASMPVIGDPESAYDTFVEQLVMNAEAIVGRAVELGVTDPDRVGVWGHSHGALMVATLLAHSDLFRAGIARSGAYNHTMRPFGFQSERRTLWEAEQTYLRLSPVMFAPQIDEPLLLIHGAADQNPGTVPLQSEKLYDAIRGTGGTARLLMLPNELHGYTARESIEHVLAEQLRWFDRWVKGAGERQESRQPPTAPFGGASPTEGGG